MIVVVVVCAVEGDHSQTTSQFTHRTTRPDYTRWSSNQTGIFTNSQEVKRQPVWSRSLGWYAGGGSWWWWRWSGEMIFPVARNQTPVLEHQSNVRCHSGAEHTGSHRQTSSFTARPRELRREKRCWSVKIRSAVWSGASGHHWLVGHLSPIRLLNTFSPAPPARPCIARPCWIPNILKTSDVKIRLFLDQLHVRTPTSNFLVEEKKCP